MEEAQEIRTVLHAKAVDDTVCVSFTYPDSLSLEPTPFLLEPGRPGMEQSNFGRLRTTRHRDRLKR